MKLRWFLNLSWLVLTALSLGVLINGLFLNWNGIGVFKNESWVMLFPNIIFGLIALGVATDARLSGFHSSSHHWWIGDYNKRRLLTLLTIALFMRGAGVLLVGRLFGWQYASLVAAGLTATDPAAISIALGMVNSQNHSYKRIFWLLTVESLLNDFEASVIYEIARGQGVEYTVYIVIFTFIMGLLLAILEWMVRQLIRIILRGAKHEGRVEVMAVFVLYLFMIVSGELIGVSPIGLVAVGAILADYTTVRWAIRMPKAEHELLEYEDIWGKFGLSLVMAAVVVFMPLKESLNYWWIGLIILAAIIVARIVYQFLELSFAVLLPTSVRAGNALISVLAAASVLGVPSAVAFDLYLSGITTEGTIMFATIWESWAFILIGVLVIQRIMKVHPTHIVHKKEH